MLGIVISIAECWVDDEWNENERFNAQMKIEWFFCVFDLTTFQRTHRTYNK